MASETPCLQIRSHSDVLGITAPMQPSLSIRGGFVPGAPAFTKIHGCSSAIGSHPHLWVPDPRIQQTTDRNFSPSLGEFSDVRPINLEGQLYIGKNARISEPALFKAMLFKGQLFIFFKGTQFNPQQCAFWPSKIHALLSPHHNFPQFKHQL